MRLWRCAVTALILLAIGLALAAAVLHATWNVLVKISGNPMGTFRRATAVAAALSTPFVLIGWLAAGRPAFTPAAAELAALSAVLELAYLWLLSAAYERGEMSVVYPIARGSAPLLAVIVGLGFLGERLSTLQLVGVGSLLLGILAVTLPQTSGRATLPALLTGVCIAAYTAVDRIGVRQTTPPWMYGWLLVVLLAAILSISMWIRSRLAPEAGTKSATAHTVAWSQAMAVGLFMWFGYLLVLFALSIAPLSLVAPLRETSVVGVAVWGVWRLHERRAAGLKLLGAAATLVGVGLLAF